MSIGIIGWQMQKCSDDTVISIHKDTKQPQTIEFAAVVRDGPEGSRTPVRKLIR